MHGPTRIFWASLTSFSLQGELQGMVSSLGYFVNAISGYVWARIYAFGLRNGVPGLIWMVIGAVQVAQMILVRVGINPIVALEKIY